MPRWMVVALSTLLIWGALVELHYESAPQNRSSLRIGTAAIAVTPFGPNPEWDGTITNAGVWGERFTDSNDNGVWDQGESFEDDAGNDELDKSSKGKYDGIYLAGFGNKRLATGKHDDYWARAMIIDDGRTRIAIVTLDFLGYYSNGPFYGLNHIEKLIDPKLGIKEILLSSTHNHGGPDTVGAWGNGTLSDGKYPKYLRFVDRQVAKSITLATRNLQPARMKLGLTDPKHSPSIAGMQTRTQNRPPAFFDEELRIMQFVGTTDKMRNRILATVINWNTHPESMEDKNTEITSDFPHTVRAEIEKKYGGTALYISGAIGAVEIIGDSNNRPTDRVRFDGRDYPLNPKNNRPAYTFDRTEAIGRDIAKAVVNAIEGAEWSTTSAIDVKKADLQGPMDNQGYQLLSRAGVLDTIQSSANNEHSLLKTSIYAITLGDAQIVTTPGELFPEVFYGVEKYRRQDCQAADTGAPIEPSIRDAMTKKYRFVLGLCPDEFGYIVPKYDWRREPVDLQKMQIRQSPDPCADSGAPSHYHETNSASSELAPASACVTVALLTGRVPTAAACQNVAKHSEYVRRLSSAKNGKE